MNISAYLDRLGHHLSFILIPHQGNDHHPYALRHSGLLIFVLGILVSQIFTNLYVGKPALTLGFATNVQKDELITLTNQRRVSNGTAAVVESPQLSQAALLKAQHMFANNYWAHVAPDGTNPWHFFNLVGYKYKIAGENLARGFDTSNGVVQGWMNSPSHRDNMLNPNYQHIGMAVLNGQLNGESTTLVVQLFGTSFEAVATAPATSNSKPVVTATPSPRPTVVALASQAASVIRPVEPTGTFNSPSPVVQVLTSFKPEGQLTTNQQVLLLSLLILASIFVVDAIVLLRKRLLHLHSHRLLHAMVVIVLIGLILINGKGFIL